jgi:acetyl esterase/lipase
MSLLPRPIDLLNKTANLAAVQVTRGLAYGNNPRQKLDIYRPARGSKNLPIIVFFYGGSWQWGARADYAFVAAVLVAQGYMVAVPDYRVYPEVRFPDFVVDSADAVSWVHEHAVEYGGDATRLFLLGHSAGAYNAAMLALAPQFLPPAIRLAGVAGLSGPYDFLPLKDPIIKAIFSPPADIKTTQPIIYASANAPPMFLATGGADRTVLPRNSTALAARLHQAGAQASCKIYPSLGHIGIILAILPYFAWRAPVLADVLAFFAFCPARELSAPEQAVPAET